MALSGLNPRHGYVPQIITSREEKKSPGKKTERGKT
jgi:hypothetical protein